MKVIVKHKFKDKHNGNIYKPGDIITISKKRFTEILNAAPLVEEIKEESADNE